MRRVTGIVVGLGVLGTGVAHAQGPALSDAVQEYVDVSAPAVALTHVQVIDGTASPVLADQTILIQDGRIAAIGPSGTVVVPDDAEVLDLSGHTVIPGMVGMHDHLFYTAAGGRRVQMNYTGPRLYLASGVTSIRTTGSNAAYADINVKADIDEGRVPGPKIHITAPYITGGNVGSMAPVNDPEAARRFVAYWAEEGASWIKAYTNITRANLAAAIEEAHARGLKATGHLCSVTFLEAVEMEIDNLEHGLLTNTDFAPAKELDQCPSNPMIAVGQHVDMTSEVVQKVIVVMIENGVSLTSTNAVIEPFIPNRPTKDQRILDAMAPEVRDDYMETRNRIDSAENFPFTEEMLLKSLQFDKMFYDAGGVLAAGVDPTGIGGALAGFGDQRNYELLVEIGFTPVQAVQVMSANGAKILGIDDQLGTLHAGKVADLVVLHGDLTEDPAVIRQVTLVFKDGVGYDSAKLIESVQGRVGIN